MARYTDGHGYCFACGVHEQGEGEQIKQTKEQRMDLLEYKPRAYPRRHLTEEVCRRYGYGSGTWSDGKAVQVATYRDDDGNPVAQKCRWPGKDFKFIGDAKQAGLFGQHLFRSGKRIIITEGEIDCLSVSQVMEMKWPVVSLPNGAQGAKKSLMKAKEYLSNFDEVVLFFDGDDAGHAAVAECAPMLGAKARVAVLPDAYKDANEALVANAADQVIRAVWNAQPYRPDGLVNLADITEEVLAPVEEGLPWCFPELTMATMGRRFREVYTLGAGTGVGKTDFLTQQIAFDVTELGHDVGVFFLEQPNHETGKRIAGKVAGKKFHEVDADWTVPELEQSLKRIGRHVHLYDHFGETDWEVIHEYIRYLATAYGVRIFYVDHLTAMADPSDERASLETIMRDVASLAQELDVMIFMVSHLTTPDKGDPHEEGGRVTIRQFKGARAIGYWSHFMFGMERDQQADDEATRHTTDFRVLKDRYTGRSVGTVIPLTYDQSTGMLREAPDNPFEEYDDSNGTNHPDF